MRGEKMSKEDFEGLGPFGRGYAVYLFGKRDDQPNVPDEENPYVEGTCDWKSWNEGARIAAQDVQDLEE